MKKYLKYIYIATACVAMNGCNYLDREPDDYLTMEMLFNDEVRTKSWLAGVYSAIPDPYWGMLCNIGYDALGDDMAPSPRWVQWEFGIVNMQQGNWSTGTTWDSNFWNSLPEKIRQARIFIEKAHPVQSLDETEIELMKNECRFLIAYYYWEMLQAYGAVPFYKDNVPLDAPINEMFVGQKPFDQMVDWIDNELLDLSEKLPERYDQPQKYGRATSIMCLAVRARMLLFAASPLVNGNEWYAEHKNNDGELIFNTEYKSDKWTKAAEACKLLIDKAHAAGHELYKEYNADGTIDPFLSYQNMLFKPVDLNPEILFARPLANSQDRPSYERYEEHATPRGSGGNGGLGVTQSLVDAFFMENGLPPISGYNADGSPIINTASGYDETDFSTADEVRTNTKWNESRGVGVVTMRDTYNMYCNREPRFYVSVLYDNAFYRTANRRVNFMSGTSDGGPTHDAPQNGYLLRKKVDPNHDVSRNPKVFTYRPSILYRLGEAYLNYAEALWHTDPNSAEILHYINLIRERAGIPAYGNGAGQITPPTSQDEMLEAIYRERRVELNCENGIRYNDLRRWLKAEKELNRDFWGMNFSGTKRTHNIEDPSSFYVRKTYQTRKFSKKCYWFPVYHEEILKDPTLVQAPFWNE